jgi:hypothetical protein
MEERFGKLIDECRTLTPVLDPNETVPDLVLEGTGFGKSPLVGRHAFFDMGPQLRF